MFYFKILISLVGLALPRFCSSLATIIRPAVELSAFFMTIVAAGTGIMIFQGETACFYSNYNNATSPDYNPELNYKFMPNGCQISNGMSVMVLISALFTFYAVMLRYKLAEVPNTSREVEQKLTNSFLLYATEEHKSHMGETISIGDEHSRTHVRSAVVL